MRIIVAIRVAVIVEFVYNYVEKIPQNLQSLSTY